MKMIKRSVLSLVVGVAMLTGCSKNNDNNNNSGGSSFTAKVDGVAYSADLSIAGTITTGTPKVCSVAGTGSGGQINLTLGNYSGPGTYNINASNPSNVAIYTLTAAPFTAYSANMVLGSGTITVSSDTGGFVEGTFSFTGQNNSGGSMVSKNITEGNFKVKL